MGFSIKIWPVVLAAASSIHAALAANAGISNKRGLVYIPSGDHPLDDEVWVTNGTDLTWYYNYGSSPVPELDGKLQFVPMLWGLPASDTDISFTDAVINLIAAGHNISHILTFNEPDGPHSTGGSAISPGDAAAAWKRVVEPLSQHGVQLGAPAVTGSPAGLTWLKSFFHACNGGCSVDFLPLHWYGNFQGLASYMGQCRAAYPNLTQWVTEYALPNANVADTQAFFNTSAEYFDRINYVERYSYFGGFRAGVSNVGANVAMLDNNGGLTQIGGWYTDLAPGTGGSSTLTACSSGVLMAMTSLVCIFLAW